MYRSLFNAHVVTPLVIKGTRRTLSRMYWQRLESHGVYFINNGTNSYCEYVLERKVIFLCFFFGIFSTRTATVRQQLDSLYRLMKTWSTSILLETVNGQLGYMKMKREYHIVSILTIFRKLHDFINLRYFFILFIFTYSV